MKRYKRIYTKIATDAKDITKTKSDFFYNVKLAMLTTKTTKNTIPESIIKELLSKIWVQFIKDCKDTNIGLLKAIDKVFNRYK